MRPVDLRTYEFKFVTSYYVRAAVSVEVEDKIFSWGRGYHDVWTALYDAIEK